MSRRTGAARKSEGSTPVAAATAGTTTDPRETQDVEPRKAKAEAEANQNLLLRVITALALLPAILWAIWRGEEPLAIVVAVAAVLGAVEFYGMTLGDDPLRVPGALAAFAIPFFHLVPSLGERGVHWLWTVLVVVTLSWRLFQRKPLESAASQVASVLLGALYLSLMGYLVQLRNLGEPRSWEGGAWLLLTCCMTWGADTGAYFAGRFFGKRKLFPRASPKKTWEGFFGGMLTAMGFAFLIRAWALPELSVFDALCLGLLAGIAGTIGDLAESMLKRASHVKDSGSLLPGHGGMLDRIDALLFNAPVVYAYAVLVVGV